MGMFDRVWFSCPGCGDQIEAQSKAAECYLTDYHSDNVPGAIAMDIHGDEVGCNRCDRAFKVIFEEDPPPIRFRMRLRDSYL